jgi:hypothetical protein
LRLLDPLARLAFRPFIALEKRVALDLLLHEALELGMGKLEKADRLQELRRHDQRLRLPHLEPGAQSHLASIHPDNARHPLPETQPNKLARHLLVKDS